MRPIAKKIEGYYVSGWWDKEMVKNAVVKGRITAEEYAEITGEAYDAQN